MKTRFDTFSVRRGILSKHWTGDNKFIGAYVEAQQAYVTQGPIRRNGVSSAVFHSAAARMQILSAPVPSP